MDFTLEVKFDSDPADGYNDQGILIEQDDGTWLRFDVYDASAGAGEKLFVGTKVVGVEDQIVNADIADGAAAYLRVTRSGDDWALDYSADGVAWSPGASFAQAVAVTSVGVYAGNPVLGLGFTAEVDYFFDAANPIDPEDPI